MLKVYEAASTTFSTNGLGTVETYKCVENKFASLGGWYLDVEAPAKYADLIRNNRIVTCETKEKGSQPFRIRNPERKGTRIFFKAHHVFFDCANYLLTNVRPTDLTPVAYVGHLLLNADQETPFLAAGNASGIARTRDYVRKTLMEAFTQLQEDMPSCIFDPEGFMIYVRDISSVGGDRGNHIDYGRQIQSLQAVENWDSVCTKLLPEGPNGMQLPEVYVESTVQYDIPYTKTMTFEVPEKNDEGRELTETERLQILREKAIEYLAEHAEPSVSYTVKADIPQELRINETVHVRHPDVDMLAVVQGYQYDVNTGRVKSLTFGNFDASAKGAYKRSSEDAQSQLKNSIRSLTELSYSLRQALEDYESVTTEAIEKQTELINRLNKTGYVYIDENEINILDKLPREEAENVWRFGLGGIAFSPNGINGPFTTAITMDGRINADFITTGTLSGDIVRAGILTDLAGKSYWNMVTGAMKLVCTEFSLENGDTIDSIAARKADAARLAAIEAAGENAQKMVDSAVKGVQDQIDGKVDTWFYDGEPTAENLPASAWTDAKEKEKHVGDLYFDTTAGFAYRYEKSENTYAWVRRSSSGIQAALTAASDAQDTADHKRRVFVSEPVPPYDVGDLWTQGEQGDILRCRTKRTSGNYVQTDWIKASKYTDDQALTQFVEGEYALDIAALQGSADSKAETWYQATDPSVSWTTQEQKALHKGDLWYNSTEGVEKSYLWNGSTWAEMKADPPQTVYDDIDGKAQIFVAQPVPPYSIGDLWVQGSQGEILKCRVARGEEESFAELDWELASKYTDDSTLNTFINGIYADDLSTVKGQIDGKAETWYQQTDPSTSWDTSLKKTEHKGDIWFDTSTGNATSQKSWLWSGSAWQEMKSTPPPSVMDTIDGKAQVFASQPTPPYYVGDLWVQGSSGDILRCTRDNETPYFDVADWELASKYTDDSALTSWINGEYADAMEDVKHQMDEKAETWYQEADPATNWTSTYEKSEHTGDLWLDTTDGKYYRYNGETWEEITSGVPQAVMNVINGKAQIFVSQPTPPYYVGDLWVQGASGEIMRCKTKRTGGSYDSSDWVKASKYTDDSAVTELSNSLTQEEIFKRLTNNGAAKGIILKDGQLYISFTYAQGGVLKLGGANNGYGVLHILSDTDAVIGSWGKGGVNIKQGSINLGSGSFTVTNTGECAAQSFHADKYIYMKATTDESYLYFPVGAYDNIPGYLEVSSDGLIVANRKVRLKLSSSTWAYMALDPEDEIPDEALDEINNYDRMVFQVKGGAYFTSINNRSIHFDKIGTYGFQEYASALDLASLTLAKDQENWFSAQTSTKTLTIRGALSVTGTKNRIVKTEEYGERLMYAYETASPYFGDIGEGTIGEDGLCYVTIDPVFAQTVSTERYQTFIQKYGDGDCWVKERHAVYFVVQGTPGLSFAWEIKAKQSDFDQRRLDHFEDPDGSMPVDYGELALDHIIDISYDRRGAA